MNEFSKYSSDIENFRNVHFKVEPVADSVTEITRPILTAKEQREQSERMMTTIRAVKKRNGLARAGIRPNLATIPGIFGPNGPYMDPTNK
jgi:hypothetical protein